LQRVVEESRRNGIAVRFVPRAELDRMAGNNAHQGVVAVTSAKQYSDLDDVVAAKRGQYSLVVVLDGVEDPHNLGAILRTADAAGADGVVVPERRAVGVTGTVAKVSAGASEHLPIAKVTNIARTLEDLKSKNLWIVGLDERGTQAYDSVDYKMDCAITLGAEGKGLHDLVRKRAEKSGFANFLTPRLAIDSVRGQTRAIRLAGLHVRHRPHWRTLRSNCDVAAASSSERRNRIRDRIRRNDTSRRNATDTNR